MYSEPPVLNLDENQNIAVLLRAVTKSYGNGAGRVTAINGVHFAALCGELLLLAGPSGCGKTTLLCLIAGLLAPDAGLINVFGKSIDSFGEEQKSAFRRENIGFVFQNFNLIPVLSATENAAVPLLIAGLPRKEALLRSEETLAQVGLAHRLRALPSSLSGGEQQRVAIARALVGNPRLLICDEPTAALDGENGARVMTLLRGAAHIRDTCVIVVTHDSRTFKYGDRIVHMSDGKIASIHQQRAELQEDIPVRRTGALSC